MVQQMIVQLVYIQHVVFVRIMYMSLKVLRMMLLRRSSPQAALSIVPRPVNAAGTSRDPELG